MVASLPPPSLPMLYGLDIETDTSCDGLDPQRSTILAVAVAGPATVGAPIVFDGPEAGLVAALDRHLAGLRPGVVVTWNGSAFDLPFLSDRARRHGLTVGLRLVFDPGIVLRRPPLPGHVGAYRASWYGHRHLDAYRVYRGDVGPTFNVSCGLKSIARLVGLAPLEVERSRIHELDDGQLSAYVASDAALTRQLAERRWATASRFVDPLREVVPMRPT